MGDQNDGLSWQETEQELPQVGGLPVGAGRFPKERVEHGQVLDRAEVKEPGRVAATAPLACEDPIDDCAGGADRRADLPRLFPAPRIEIALGGAVAERKRFGICGSGAWAWRTIATMPVSDRRAKRASADVGAGRRRKVAMEARARSRRVIGCLEAGTGRVLGLTARFFASDKKKSSKGLDRVGEYQSTSVRPPYQSYRPSSLVIPLSIVHAHSPGELPQFRLYRRKLSLHLAPVPIIKGLPDPFS